MKPLSHFARRWIAEFGDGGPSRDPRVTELRHWLESIGYPVVDHARVHDVLAVVLYLNYEVPEPLRATAEHYFAGPLKCRDLELRTARLFLRCEGYVLGEEMKRRAKELVPKLNWPA